MKTVLLDSSPSVNINLRPNPPGHVESFIRNKGQPILGQNLSMFYHFVPLNAHSDPHLKEVLSVPETDDTSPETIDSLKELSKNEKILKGEDVTSTLLDEQVLGSDFEKEARKYMKAAKPNQIDTFETTEDPKELEIPSEKNAAELATIIAAAQPPRRHKYVTKPKKRKPMKAKEKTVKKKRLSAFKVFSKPSKKK